jgi:hypothetical protein
MECEKGHELTVGQRRPLDLPQSGDCLSTARQSHWGRVDWNFSCQFFNHSWSFYLC